MKVANNILVAVLVAFLVLGGATAWNHLDTSADFRFGDSMGWRYRSVAHYVGMFSAEIALSAIGIAAGAFRALEIRQLLVVRAVIVGALLLTALL